MAMLQQNIDVVAFSFFLVCLIITYYSRKRARKIEDSGKSIRSHYRSNWIKNMVEKDNYDVIIQEMRNNIIVSTAFVSGIIIAFGLVITVASSNIIPLQIGFLPDLRILSMLVMLAYALFMLIVELRTLLYIPVVFGTKESIIKQYEGIPKIKYLSHLIHDTFDHFSNTIRAIFFLLALLTWFYNPYIFMVAALIVTLLLVIEDFGKESRVTIF